MMQLLLHDPLRLSPLPTVPYPLIGLKENVLIGKLIPAGTGMKRYRNVKLDTGDGNIDMSEVTGEETGDFEEADATVEETVNTEE